MTARNICTLHEASDMKLMDLEHTSYKKYVNYFTTTCGNTTINLQCKCYGLTAQDMQVAAGVSGPASVHVARIENDGSRGCM